MRPLFATFVVACALAIAGGTARLGSLRAALAIDRMMLKLLPSRADLIWLHMALLYDRTGKLIEALECLTTGRAVSVEPFMFELETARILEKTGDPTAAASVYDRILKSYPELDKSFRESVSAHLVDLHGAQS